MVCSFCQQGEVVFEVEQECGRPCPLRLSETGEAWQLKQLIPSVRKKVSVSLFLLISFLLSQISHQVIQNGSALSSQTFPLHHGL